MLHARRREPGRPRRVRAEGDVPAILYGRDVAPTPVRVSGTELARLAAAGHLHGLIDLVLEGEERPLAVLVREVQRDPVKGHILHVDFFRVALDEPIDVTVPIVVTGAEEVERRGGIIQHQLHELEVTCLPDRVPEAITVDVSRLGVGDALTVAEITPPPGVTITSDPDAVVLVVLEPRAGAEEEAGEAAADAAEA